jgi:hypothetical protein
VLCVLGVLLGLRLADSRRDGPADTLGQLDAWTSTAAESGTRNGSLDQQVGAASTAVADGGDFTLVVTESEANTRLARSGGTGQSVDTPLGTARITEPRVRFTPGEAVLQTRLTFGVADTALSMYAGVDVDSGGRAALRVRRVDLGGVALPAAVRDQLQTAAQSQMEEAIGDLPVNIRRVEIESGRLVVYGSGE